MALIEQTVTDKIEVVGPHKQVQVRQDKQIVDDVTNEIKAKGQWHRYILSPGDDISGQSADIQGIANSVWTDEVKDAYAAHLAKQEL